MNPVTTNQTKQASLCSDCEAAEIAGSKWYAKVTEPCFLGTKQICSLGSKLIGNKSSIPNSSN